MKKLLFCLIASSFLCFFVGNYSLAQNNDRNVSSGQVSKQASVLTADQNGTATITTNDPPSGSNEELLEVTGIDLPAPEQSAPLTVCGKCMGGMNVYPNPVQRVVRIEDDDVLGKITVFDLNGRMILTKDVNASSTDFDLSSLPAGNYLMKADSWEKPIRIHKQ